MTANPLIPKIRNRRVRSLNILAPFLFLLAFLFNPRFAFGAPDAKAGWNGGGGGNQNWSSAANWTTAAGFTSPPFNPMTQSKPGNGLGTIEHSSSIGSPEPSTEVIDAPWTIGALSTIGRSFNLSGQDLTIQQATAISLVLTQAAIQIGNNNATRTLNISNNIIFDDFVYKSEPTHTNYLHAIVQRVGNTTINFYGRLSKPTTNGAIIFRTQSPINIYGGVSANLTPDLSDTSNGPYNVEVAMLRDGGAGGTLGSVNFYYTNNSWSYMSVDRGIVNIYTNDALPVASQMLLGDTPGRVAILALNDNNQTFNFINESGGAPSVARNIDTGSGVGGTLTLNDNGVTNDWPGIAIIGTGRLVKNGNGTLIFEKNQTYSGSTVIGAGVLQLGVGTAGGLLSAGANITNNGTLIINSTDSFSGGNLFGTGGLQKLTANSVNFTAASYSGNTYVAGGTLTIGGGDLSPSPSITLSGGATLDLSATAGLTRSSGQSLNGSGTVSGTVNVQPGSSMTIGNSAGTLSLGGSVTLDSTTLNMELSSDPTTIGGGVNDLLSVGGTLSLANVSTINVTPLGALNTATPYKIIQYGALSGLPANLTASLPFPGRYSFTVQDAPPYIQLAVTATLNGNLLWRGGAAGNPTRWDVATTTNWLNGLNPDAYLLNDPIAFDDTALTNRATLAANVTSPSLVTSNNSTAYTVDGSGSLTVANLGIEGSGSFTLANSSANNLGAVVVNAGSLVIGNTGSDTTSSLTVNGGSLTATNGGALTAGSLTLNNGNLTIANNAPDSLGAVGVTNGTLAIANNGPNSYASIAAAGGTLAFSQPTNVSVATTIVGGGTITKGGANKLTLAADNSAFTGPIQVNSGSLVLGMTNALGSGNTVTIANGASLYINYPLENHQINTGPASVVVQGAGVGGQGAIGTNGGAYQGYALKNITLTGDTTFGGGWENLGGVFTGGGFKITKVGPGDVFIDSTTQDTDFGDIEIVQGLFGIENAGTTFGRPNNTITVRSNASLSAYACLTAGNKNIIMDDGARIAVGGGAGGPSMYGGTMTLNGTAHVLQYNANTASLHTYNGTISGPGTLSVDAVATYALAGENINSGGFVVTNGALRLSHNLAASTNMTIVVKTNGLSGSGQVVGVNVPRLELSDGVVIPSGVTVHLNSAGTGDNRNTFGVVTATTGEFQGTTIPHGDGTVCLVANNAASVFTISGQITNMDYVGTLNFRGPGNGFLSGPIKFGGNVGHNPSGSGVWTISSTGNQWANTVVSSSRLIVGANDALCVTAPVFMAAAGNLDLGGFNQTVPFVDSPGGAGVIGNSSTTSDSLLTLNGATNITTMTNAIVDVINSGTMKVALTVTNTTALLFGANTYTGPTLVKNGGILGGAGSLASAVTVESGGTLSPGASIGVMTINNTLTLNAGSTSLMEVSHPPSNDGVLGVTTVTYGGTLVVTNIGGSPLAAGDSFPLFQAGAYNGNFASIVLPALDPGLVWNTNNLAVNGTLSVVATAPPHVDVATRLPDGNIQLTLSGPSGAGYSIHASTNVALPLSSWPVINSGTISTSPFTYSDLTATNFSQRFYRMSVP